MFPHMEMSYSNRIRGIRFLDITLLYSALYNFLFEFLVFSNSIKMRFAMLKISFFQFFGTARISMKTKLGVFMLSEEKMFRGSQGGHFGWFSGL